MKESLVPSIGERRVGIGAALLLIAAAALFAWLGRWQMQRGEELRALEAVALAAESAPLIDMRANGVTDADIYRRAVVEGTFDASQQFYLEGKEQQGRIGYHVITALREAGTRRYLLVNRGWLPEGERTAPVPAGTVRVSGVLVRAQLPGLRLGTPTGATRPYIDPQEYAVETGRAVEPLLLVASEQSEALTPVAVTRHSKRGVHEGYALQWFIFAVIALAIAAVILSKRMRARG